jgi:hypothetical protein
MFPVQTYSLHLELSSICVSTVAHFSARVLNLFGRWDTLKDTVCYEGKRFQIFLP